MKTLIKIVKLSVKKGHTAIVHTPIRMTIQTSRFYIEIVVNGSIYAMSVNNGGTLLEEVTCCSEKDFLVFVRMLLLGMD